jgi:hypothetical protein
MKSKTFKIDLVEETRLAEERLNETLVYGGKYSGDKIGSLSRDYCEWVLKNTSLSAWNKDIIDKAYLFRKSDKKFQNESLAIDIKFHHHDYPITSYCKLHLSNECITEIKMEKNRLIEGKNKISVIKPTDIIHFPMNNASITANGNLPDFKFKSFVAVSKDWFQACLVNEDKKEKYYSNPLSYDLIT